MFVLCSVRPAASAVAAGAIAAQVGSSHSKRDVMRYEERLGGLFARGDAKLEHMALAHIAGFGDRLPDWLARTREAKRNLNTEELQRVFAALLAGDAASIEEALRGSDPGGMDFLVSLHLSSRDRRQPEWLDVALGVVVDPLILLGRGDVLAALHANSLHRLGAGKQSSVTVAAALALGKAGEWAHAREILDLARRGVANIDVAFHEESFLWQYAYLHGQVDSVMPLLAEMPFRSELPHLAEARQWKLKAYQIRVGRPGIDVPVIADKQPHGYVEAAAMQIAALDGDPSAADLVAKLRRALRPRSVDITYVDGGVSLSLDMVDRTIAKAAAQIAARRKDSSLGWRLRDGEGSILIDPASDLINAFLEEADWRGAAKIAEQHDPRRRPVPRGFDDDRVHQYVRLYIRLALAAAWSGDDAGAAECLGKGKAADQAQPPDNRPPGENPFLWLKTLLAGAAEGLLPRRFLDVLTHGQLDPY
jgi:hypothetical protein